MTERITIFMRNVWSNTTIEPVIAIYYLIIALSGIVGEELYLKKACLVNFNNSAEVCDNIYAHKEIQVETQKYISGIQSISSILQNVPGIIFALFAGALSDSYGRKPLIIIPLFGYFILNLVFLINSIWFKELKVEYLMFECLQDLTGGSIVFTLATKCFIVDITTEENRTSRLAITDAFLGLGYLIGIPLGTRLKNLFGYNVLFSVCLGLAILAMIYAGIFIEDSYHLVSDEKKKAFNDEREINVLKCDKGVCKRVYNMMISSFKTIHRKRQNNDQTWIILLTLIFVLNAIVTNGATICAFMFYRLQYNATIIDYGNLMTAYFISSIFAQTVVVPFLSKKLQFRDTTILIIAIGPTCIIWLVEAFSDQLWIPFLNWALFYPLSANLYTTPKSLMSKMLQPNEVGKAFSLLAVIESGMGLIFKPVFGLLYRETVDFFAGMWIIVSVGILFLALILTIVLHFGTKNNEVVASEDELSKMKNETIN